MNQLGRFRSGLSTANYMEDPLLSSFFEAREHGAYYRSLRHASDRRDFHTTLVPILMEFVGEFLAAKETKLLDEIIESSVKTARRKDESRTPAEQAKELNPEAAMIFRIGEELSFSSLKNMYRRAARECHPDMGGTNEKMILVNDAYERFHELLCVLANSGSDTTESPGESIWFDEPRVKTGQDFACEVCILLLELKIDEFSYDDAHYWAMQLADNFLGHCHFADHVITKSRVLMSLGLLAGRLWFSELKNESREVYRFAEVIWRSLKEKGGGAVNPLENADACRRGEQKLRLVLNHSRQAENALRLGLIDRRRYEKTIDRLGKGREAWGRSGESLRDFALKIGFIQNLPTDILARAPKGGARLVPVPGYLEDSPGKLSEDQQAEYVRAFGQLPELDLVKKYSHVRLVSLLRTLILHPDSIDSGAIERECRHLSKILAGQSASDFVDLADLAGFMSSLEPEDRRTRLTLLRQLHEKSTDRENHIITISLKSGGIVGAPPVWRFRAVPGLDYYETAKLSLQRLRLAILTGATKTEAEQESEKNHGIMT